MKIGVISDTHGYLDPRVRGLFEGVEHILHAGDIGHGSIIVELEQVAPVTAVLGNNDFGLPYRETEVIELATRRFLLHHIVAPETPDERLKSRLARESPDVVVFGHSHRPHCQTLDGILFFNPGYAGKPRFNLRRTVALLHCDQSGIRPELIEL
jgi:uncharacterized protein